MSRITVLPRIIEMLPDRPMTGGPDHPMRKVTRQIAFEPGGWTPERRQKVTELFDGLAPDWDGRMSADETNTPLRDALDRGGPVTGPCVEVGAGTGRATELLAQRFGPVLAVDLSAEMLRRFREPTALRALADGAALPVADHSIGTVVLVNAFLFPAEIERVLRPDGAVVWVNTLGQHTPIHLPVADVIEALPGDWAAVTAEAGWGLWAVIRREA